MSSKPKPKVTLDPSKRAPRTAMDADALLNQLGLKAEGAGAKTEAPAAPPEGPPPADPPTEPPQPAAEVAPPAPPPTPKVVKPKARKKAAAPEDEMYVPPAPEYRMPQEDLISTTVRLEPSQLEHLDLVADQWKRNRPRRARLDKSEIVRLAIDAFLQRR